MDHERVEAESRLLRLVAELCSSGQVLSSDLLARSKRVSELDDAALAKDLRTLKLLERHREQNHEPAAKTATLEVLRQRCESVEVGGVVRGLPSWRAWAELEGDADFPRYLEDALGLVVAPDGLCEIERISPLVDFRMLLGQLPVALYHHTASGEQDALLTRIQATGLMIGRQTNFFNTQAGVYVSTRRAGVPHDVYSRRATLVHGGSPVVWRCAVSLCDIQPDPDDADLAWAQGVQFVTPSVAPSRVSLNQVFDCLGAFGTWIADCREASLRGLTPDAMSVGHACQPVSRM